MTHWFLLFCFFADGGFSVSEGKNPFGNGFQVSEGVRAAPIPKAKPARHLLFFTQGAGCIPCVREEENEFPLLEKQGFKIAKIGEVANISRVNVYAAENAALVTKHGGGSTPCFVLLEGDQVLGKRVGFQTAKQLADWYHAVPKEVRRSRYPQRSSNWSGPVGNRESAINHLLYGGEHAGKFSRHVLEKLSLWELWSLHSDDHERRVHWDVLGN